MVYEYALCYGNKIVTTIIAQSYAQALRAKILGGYDRYAFNGRKIDLTLVRKGKPL